MKNFILSLLLLSTFVLFAGCTEDEMVSKLPAIENMTFDTDVLYQGEEVTVTVVQSKKGELLHTAKYEWTCSYAAGSITGNAEVVYDKNSQNPQWKFIVPECSSLTIKFVANYYPSAGTIKAQAQGGTVNGTSVTYTVASLVGKATVSKSVKVYKRQINNINKK